MVPIARRLLAYAASLFCLGIATFPGPAEARDDVPAIRIVWPSMEGCPTSKAVLDQANRAVAGVRELDRVFARAELEPPKEIGDPWRVRIRTLTIGGKGERVLEARNCEELGRATALLVALTAMRASVGAASPGASLEEILPPGDFEGPEGAPTKPVRLARRPPPPRLAPRELGHPGVALGFWADSSVLPKAAFGPSLHLDYELGSFRGRVSGFVSFEQEELRGNAGATFDLIGLSLELCYGKRMRAIRPHACVGGEIDRIEARGTGGEANFETTRGTGFLFGDVGVEYVQSTPLRIGLDARVGPTIRRPIFVAETASGERRELHQPSGVRIQGIVWVGVVF